MVSHGQLYFLERFTAVPAAAGLQLVKAVMQAMGVA
jgi:hypothetical protein